MRISQEKITPHPPKDAENPSKQTVSLFSLYALARRSQGNMGSMEVFSAEKLSTNRGKSGKSGLLAKADRLAVVRLGTGKNP